MIHFSLYFLIGLFGTALMDLGAMVGTRLKVLNKPNLALLGRWAHEILKGRFVFRNGTIASAPVANGEKTLGLVIHYAIGGVLGITFGIGLMLTGLELTPLTAIVFGFFTNIFPWLVMFPALGFGFFGFKTPPEAKLLRTSCVNHLVYGLGLYLAAAAFGFTHQ